MSEKQVIVFIKFFFNVMLIANLIQNILKERKLV